MNQHQCHDPYAGNMLVSGLGPILSRSDAAARLMHMPPLPVNITEIPKHVRIHYLMAIRDLHLPSLEGVRTYQSMDLMIRQGYRYRNPQEVGTWKSIYGGTLEVSRSPRMPAMAATVVGHSGVGKTESIIRALNCYPRQVLEHERFPQLRGKHKQVVWLSVDVPQSGRLFDLITNLMASWDSLLLKNDLSARPRFEHSMPKRSSDMARAANEWLRVATAHFLGILHLDEVQNFFKIDTLKSRRNRANGEKGIELSIAEDGCLKWILMLINTWGIPVVFSGTPDGIGALTKRMSTAQRTVTCGYHHMTHFTDHKSKNYEMLLRQLLKYQYVDKPLRLSNELAEVVLRLSGGVPRIIVALWVAAQRMALERSTDELKITDFLEAASTLLAPLAPAVDALRSNDPRRMSRYEDLVTGDKEFWGVFWNSVAIA